MTVILLTDVADQLRVSRLVCGDAVWRGASLVSSTGESWRTLLQTFRTKIFLALSDALNDGARGRTIADVAIIRHVYLDFDENGTAAVETLVKREDLPKPNYLVNGSPDKWQVVWKVEGFGKAEAEALQQALVRETGADPAATDSARVLRLPGSYNNKYASPYSVRVESLAAERYRPEQFPKFPANERLVRSNTNGMRNPFQGETGVPGNLAVRTRLGLCETGPGPRRTTGRRYRRYRKLPPLRQTQPSLLCGADGQERDEIACQRAHGPERCICAAGPNMINAMG
jgi:hypothetical protein